MITIIGTQANLWLFSDGKSLLRAKLPNARVGDIVEPINESDYKVVARNVNPDCTSGICEWQPPQ